MMTEAKLKALDLLFSSDLDDYASEGSSKAVAMKSKYGKRSYSADFPGEHFQS